MSIYHGNSRVYYVDSYNRLLGSHTNFSIKLDLPSTNKYNKVALLQLSVPKSFYNFASGKNTFILIEKGVEYTITIPVGSYNKNNLLTNLSSLLTSASGNAWTYTATYPTSTQANTGKITFAVSGNGAFQPSLKFVENCWIQLGFEKNTTYPFTASSLTAPNYLCLSPINRIYVKSSMCNTSQDSILQEVLQTYPDNSFIYYENINVDINSKDFTSSSSDTVFNFNITDRFGNTIDTNGLNVMMSILLYEKNNTDEVHKQDLMIKNLERLYNLEEQKVNMESAVAPSNVAPPTETTPAPTIETQQPLMSGSTTNGVPNTAPITIASERNIGSVYGELNL